MGSFDSEKGLFHLVFANEDTYYLQSLLRLNLRQYLYYKLKQQNYQAIYFLNGDDGVYELDIADGKSVDLYEKYEKQTFLDIFKGKSPEEKRGKRVKINDRNAVNEFFERMIQLLKKERQIAFVFSIDAFAVLAEYQDVMNTLCQLAEKNYNRRHMILIQAPVIADGSRPYFADDMGVFQSNLFPEIQQIFNRHKNIHIYEKLKEEMGDRVVFLNKLERNAIHHMVLHFLLNMTPEMSEYFSSADDYADFIWAWYHSNAFRMSVEPLFTDNKKRLMSIIEKNLSDKAIFSRMDTCIRHLRETHQISGSLRQWILEHYPKDNSIRLIYEDNVILRKIENFSLQSMAENNPGINMSFMQQSLEHIKEELQKPSIIVQDMPKSTEYINECIEHMQNAYLKRDRLTLEKAITALEYGICQRFSDDSLLDHDTDENIADKRWMLYINTIQVAENLYEITKAYHQDSKKIEAYNRYLKKSIQDIHAFELEHFQVIEEERRLGGKTGTMISGDLHLLSAKKAEAVNLKNDIRNLEHLRVTKQKLISKCKDNIQKIEMAISNLSAGNLQFLTDNLEYITKIVQKVSVEKNQLFKELSEASMDLQYTFEESSAMHADDTAMSQMDIDREFDKILEEQDAGQEKYTEKVVHIND